MTNAERFIGDEDLIDTFIEEFNEFVIKNSKNATPLRELIEQFLKQPIKPEEKKPYVIINHCNGEIMEILECELTERELQKYLNDEYIIFQRHKDKWVRL